MSSDNKLKIVLLRHGETVYNIEKRLQSSKDSLTEKGKEQAKLTKQELSNFKFDKIFCSDEKRAMETTEILSQWLELEPEITSLIREKSSGDFSDKLSKEVDWSIVKGSFLDKKIPNGESVRDVMMRALEFSKILNSFEQGKHVLVVSHGTFLRILFCLILNKDIEDYLLNYEFPNAKSIVLTRNDCGLWEIENSNLIKKEAKQNG